MASILKVDDLRGNTAAGNITITSEGGSATQSLQQGLIKHFVNFNGTGTPAVNDSLNHSSITDNGTGDFTHTVTSAFNNSNYVPDGTCANSTSNPSSRYASTVVVTTSTYREQPRDQNNTLDLAYNTGFAMGDLA